MPTKLSPEERQEQKAQNLKDLVAIFEKPLEEYTQEELVKFVTKIRQMRQVDIKTKRKKVNPLDALLKKLDPKTARHVLQQLTAQDEETK